MKTNSRPTIDDVYRIVNRLEDKMDKRLTHIESLVERNTAFKNKVIGISGIIGAVAGGAVSLIWDKLNGK